MGASKFHRQSSFFRSDVISPQARPGVLIASPLSPPMVMRAALLLALAALARADVAHSCRLEPGRSYPSLWNETALRECSGAPRAERVCMVGAGAASVHLAWLLKRRLFVNITLFEASGRIGGDTWTRKAPGGPADNVTRELGAAFLSPDYHEVRALLARFGQKELPLSKRTQLEFRTESAGSAEAVQTPDAWANERVSRYTHTTNATANAALRRVPRPHQRRVHAGQRRLGRQPDRRAHTEPVRH